jgi:NAD+ kinase
MKIALLGKKVDNDFDSNLGLLFNKVEDQNAELFIYEPFKNLIQTETSLKLPIKGTFSKPEEITPDFDFFISLGGDGTFLESVRFVRDSQVPVVGINTGRLGFLANIAGDDIIHSLNCLFSKQFQTEKRSLIQFDSISNPFHDFPYGLNEITVQKRDTSLITIHTHVNGKFLNSYWTDGLIISTPTGSTAYSMSVGGPIIAPECKALIMSPIASHNLSVRPIVLTDDIIIKLIVEARAGKFMATIDSRTHEFIAGTEIELKLAPFSINMVKLSEQTFFNTIRKKLLWGVDIRN